MDRMPALDREGVAGASLPRTARAVVAARWVLEGGSGAAPSGERSGQGPYVLLELEAPRLARTVQPGQLVRLRVDGQAQPFHVASRWARGISLLIRPGWGISTRVAALEPGTALEVTGPLGRGFAPVEGRAVWHVAEPGRLHGLLLASLELPGAGETAVTQVGQPAPPAWWLAWQERQAARAGPGAAPRWLPLDDLERLEGLLAGLPQGQRPVLRAAGSTAFLAQVARLAGRQRVDLQVTVEQPMPCGMGLCLGCAVPQVEGDGATRWVRACREGPVFDGSRLDWDRMPGSRVAVEAPAAGGPTTGGNGPVGLRRRRAAGELGLPDPGLNVQLGPTRFRNPLMPASGCFGYGREMGALYPLRLLGAVVTKGLSRVPWEGRPAPRVAWAAGGLMNAIGLQNPGVEHFLREELPFLVVQGAAVVVNVVGATVTEYAAVAARLEEAPRFPAVGAPGKSAPERAQAPPYTPGHGGLVALELNISCPNVDAGGLHFGQDPEIAAQVVQAVRAVSSLPLWVKLSPQGPVLAVARAVVEAGAQVLSVANTLPALALDPRSGAPKLSAGPGGLSGPPLKPVSLALVHRLRRELPVPIVGIGGIRRVEDVLEYRHAGATAVAVGSAHFDDPYVLLKLRRDLKRHLQAWKAAGGKEAAGEVGS